MPKNIAFWHTFGTGDAPALRSPLGESLSLPVCIIKLSHFRGSLHEVRGAYLMKITSITTVQILTFARIVGLPRPGTEGFVLSFSAQSMVKDFEQSHLIPPKMQTKLEISRQAELFPSSGFFQPRKVVLFCANVRVGAE